MRAYTVTICICAIFLQGCSYPQYKIQSLDELTFNNKRLGNHSRKVQEFIKPEQTKNVLTDLKIEEFSSDKEANLVLNILNYTQNLKETKDRKEFWQYPEETIARGGDCEDKTFLLLSMLIQAGIKGVKGVKGKYLGGGHMWVEYKLYILDPLKETPKLIPIEKSLGYNPYFKFDQKNSYYCDKKGR